MITVRPSPTADTRTCDVKQVTKKMLLDASQQHITDVRRGLAFLVSLILEAGNQHDYDKITDIDSFYADFQTNFVNKDWWDRHRKLNRHHLAAEDGVPQDVNLIDVLEYITDCVMASRARGSSFPIVISSDLLVKAFENTVTLLKDEVVIDEQ